MSKKPEAYKTPLQRRHDIADYLMRVGNYWSTHNGRSIISFNVKCHDTYRVLGSFADLIAFCKQHCDLKLHCMDNPEWLKPAEEKYDEVDQHLFDWGVEEARSHFVGRGGSGKPDSDCYTHLYDGTLVDVEYCFMGRSGGYLGIDKFEGYNFGSNDPPWWYEVLKGNPHKAGMIAHEDWLTEYEEFSYESLRKLYALVRMLQHDVAQEKANAEVIYCACWTFIHNVCNGIVQPTHTQLELPMAAGE